MTTITIPPFRDDDPGHPDEPVPYTLTPKAEAVLMPPDGIRAEPDLSGYPEVAPPGSPAAGLRRETVALGFVLAHKSGTGTPLAWARWLGNPQAWHGHGPENCTEACESTHGGAQ